MAVVWSETGVLSLQQQWLQASIRFWNQVVVLPVGDLHRDLMFDSLQEAVAHGPFYKGFFKGLTDEQCTQIGFSLADLGLLPVNLKMIMNLSQLATAESWDGWRGHLSAHLSLRGRHGLHLRTVAGFYVSQGKAGGLSSSCRLMRARSHSLCASAWAATGYPVTRDAIGRNLSHAVNVCAPGVRTHGRGDEKHMVFECSALQHIRDKYPALFAGHYTMRLLFILSLNAWTRLQQSHGVRCIAILWWMGQRYWIVLVYELTLSHWCINALHVAISPVDCWLILFIYFSACYFAVPDAWHLWAGPRLAYCCG